LVEILLLSGGTPYANFKDLAHAWGREKGFHHVLAASVCERRGEVERKRRSDAGKTLSNEQKELFRQKLKRTRTDTSDTITDTADDTLVEVGEEAEAEATPGATTTTMEEEEAMETTNGVEV
jgi:uncharacterized membrane protein